MEPAEMDELDTPPPSRWEPGLIVAMCGVVVCVGVGGWLVFRWIVQPMSTEVVPLSAYRKDGNLPPAYVPR